MSRYDHALNRKPEKEDASVRTFGFNDDVVSDFLRIRKNFPYFKLYVDEEVRISIIVEDPLCIFTGAYVHWYDRYILCNSVTGHRALCCEKLKNRIFRTACIIVNYKTGEVMPWCFGKRVFEKLQNLNDLTPLDTYDILVKRRGERFPIYDVGPCGETLWKSYPFVEKENILKQVAVYQRDIKDIIGVKLSPAQIHEIIIK